MKKKIAVLLGIGITFFIVPFLINIYSIFRLISLAIGIIIIVISINLMERHNIILTLLLPLILIILAYGADTFLLNKFMHVPIFVYGEKSSAKMKTYNSFFYRIYNCDGSLVLDYGYKKSYACSDKDLDVINVNTLLHDPHASYQKYDNKFVKVAGKVSKITGNESIELSLFTNSENSLNGYVNFNTNYSLKVESTADLSSFRVYDEITVIGRVEQIDEVGGQTIINLKDTKIIPSSIYDDYTFEVVTNDVESLTDLDKENNYYYYGITSLNVLYNADNIYELSYLLSDSKIKWDDLIKDGNLSEYKDENEKVIMQKYEFDKYTLVSCANNKKIIANKKFNIDENICSLELENS